jgi:hypothetical protein
LGVDELVDDAVRCAAIELEQRSAELGHELNEIAHLTPVLEECFESMGANVIRPPWRPNQLPNWTAPPGSIDITIEIEGEHGTLRACLETKWLTENKMYECLWDANKMAAVAELPEVAATYLVCGASITYFDTLHCAELFRTNSVRPADLINGLPQGWWQKYILDDSAGEFVAVSSELDLKLVANEPAEITGKPWQLRAVGVPPTGDDPVPCVGGFPT